MRAELSLSREALSQRSCWATHRSERGSNQAHASCMTNSNQLARQKSGVSSRLSCAIPWPTDQKGAQVVIGPQQCRLWFHQCLFLLMSFKSYTDYEVSCESRRMASGEPTDLWHVDRDLRDEWLSSGQCACFAPQSPAHLFAKCFRAHIV